MTMKTQAMKNARRHGSSVAVAVALGMASTVTLAAQLEEIEVIVVTGSHIGGAAETAALPVDVLRAEDIEKQGAPTVVELLKQLPSSGVVLGDTNQFAALSQGQEGTGSVNLRGLGASRTLVLLNGRRMAMNALSANGAVDTNLIPVAAISRVEVLKDGAAATYGSDAIGGVVNFITRRDFDGLDLAADYRYVDGSDGDYRASATWGWTTDRASVLFSAGYQHRSELMSTDRDWALRPNPENPQGGWSGSGNPGTFRRVTATGAALGTANVADPQCAALGSFAASAASCSWSYMKFDALAEEEDKFQVFSSLDYDVTENTGLHLEALYSNTDVPHQPLSPSYSLNNFPTGQTLNAGAPAVPFRYIVPCTNPGLQDMFIKNPAFAAAIGGEGCVNAAGAPAGSYTATALWRPFGESGNLVQGGDSQIDKRSHEGLRVSAGLDGSIGDSTSWDVSVTYMQNTGERFNYDITVNRLQLALAGLGGPNCTGNTPGMNGCQWLNPFSNAVERNVVTGEVNPQYNPAVRNTEQLNAWLQQPLDFEATTELMVVDAVLNGELPFALGGDKIGWALGAQYRDNGYETTVNDLANVQITPCIDSPSNPSATCLAAQGPFGFLSGYSPLDVDQQVWAVFGELNVPIVDTLNAQLAVRYEDYGGGVGSTTNPKLALRWQIIPQLALRGSVGTTFRGPTPMNLDPGSGTSLQAIAAANFASRAVDSYGNPNLKPETADTLNAGIITEIGGFRATLDYWQFKFEDPITAPPFNGIASNVVPTPGGLADCSAPMRDLVTFDGGNTCVQGVTTGANLLRVRVDTINGAPVETSGVDLDLGYTFDNVLGGTLDLSAYGSYILNYEVDALSYRGVPLVAAFDAVGYLNYDRGQNSLPELKASAFVNYEIGIQNFNVGVSYVSSYEDNRTALFATNPNGRTIEATTIWDLSYQLRLASKTTVSLTVDNVLDEDPAFARTELSYDSYVGNALGRTYRLGLRQQF
ncbi:iron complex outermembrane receptor protein [Povalibacter uvarum]|uniref:Iron complex outermembrane receptor protein n=1 Tax=Povalibacter uvarum TaxID=732238 RepID=A0A841HJU9_9GAMM|nr:TonB-dependent receptor [Povalibacter uvarum]MBB6093481.1 iron complex outermembrane receptor protein [Povalibacter uvarum]